MGLINFDEDKVNFYVLPSISKAEHLIQGAYDMCSTLKNVLPNSFEYKNVVSSILCDIYVLKLDTNSIQDKIKSKQEKINFIENKNNKKSLKIFDTISNLGKKTVSTVSVESNNEKIKKAEDSIINGITAFADKLKSFFFKKDDKTNDTKKTTAFSKFTDLQSISVHTLMEIQDENISLGKDGKTINQIYKELMARGNKKSKNVAQLINNNLINQGMGEFTVVEIVSGTNGFDAIVIKDLEENYLIEYPGTNPSEKEDVFLDAYKIFEFLLDDEQKEQILYIAENLESGLVPGIIKKLSKDLGKTIEEVASIIKNYNKYYNSQVKQAQELTLKYANKAQEANKAREGKNISVNISGYSLGGTLAEESAVYILEKKYSDVLGTINLYNPYHADLSDSQINKLKKTDDFRLYCAEGDMVSSIFDQNKFDDVAKYIYFDYKSSYDNLKKQSKLGVNISEIADNFWTKSLDSLVGMNVDSISGKTLKSFQHIPLIFEGPHSVYNIINSAPSFNADGSLKKEVILKNGEVYKVDGVSFDEISKYVFGHNIKKTGAKIVKDLNLNTIFTTLKGSEMLKSNNVFAKGTGAFVTTYGVSKLLSKALLGMADTWLEENIPLYKTVEEKVVNPVTDFLNDYVAEPIKETVDEYVVKPIEKYVAKPLKKAYKNACNAFKNSKLNPANW